MNFCNFYFMTTKMTVVRTSAHLQRKLFLEKVKYPPKTQQYSETDHANNGWPSMPKLVQRIGWLVPTKNVKVFISFYTLMVPCLPPSPNSSSSASFPPASNSISISLLVLEVPTWMMLFSATEQDLIMSWNLSSVFLPFEFWRGAVAD